MIDLCFNLGLKRLLGFRKFLEAMSLGEYERAAVELQDSLWFKQVKSRGPEIVGMIRGSTEV
jgi:lysozyme